MNSGQTPLQCDPGQPTATALLAEAILLTAADLGLDRSQLCQLALSRQLPKPASEDRIVEDDIIKLLKKAAVMSQHPDFGLRVGQHTRLGSYGALGYALMNCATLGDAFELIPRYETVVLESGLTQHGLRQGRTYLTWQRKHHLPCPDELVDVFFSSWLSLASWMTGQIIRCDEVHLQRPSPGQTGPYENFFGAPVIFNASENALIFDSEEALACRLIEADPQLNQLMISRLDNLHKKLATHEPVSARVCQQLRQRLPAGITSIAAVASAMAMSERTLRRKLAEENSSYHQLLSQTRHELACEYLQNTSMSILEIALLLGYREHSSFSAAFKNWQSCSPQEYRANHPR